MVRPSAPATPISTKALKEIFPSPLALSTAMYMIQDPTVTLMARHHSSCGTGIIPISILLLRMPKVQQDIARNATRSPLLIWRLPSSLFSFGERRTSPPTIRTAAPKTAGLTLSPRNIHEAGTTSRG